MKPEYRSMMNAQGLKALLKAPEMPKPALAIAGDDEMSNVPMVIFTYQSPRPAVPVLEKLTTLPYEKTAAKGANDTLSMDDFPTGDFDLGANYASIL